MGTFTSRLNLFKPAPTDLMSDVNGHLNGNLDKLDAAAPFIRGSSFPVSPYQGQIAVRSDQNDTAWVRYSQWYDLMAKFTPPFAETETDVTTTSTSFVTTGTVVSVTFTAPASGRLWASVSGFLQNSASSTTVLGVEVRETNGAGAVVQAAADRKALQSQGQFGILGTKRVLITGLTAFTQTYYAQLMLRVTSGATTGTAFWRGLEIERRRTT